ncbi:MAG: TetR/AcrR family transcriptional regulator [Deltaproteobacteria bacterium]|nr:TetR/AcrR family transcriptional regulator [Deltaproteobacteria bacterium]
MAKAKDTKALLLKTAMELIWAHNYGSVSVDDICRAAGAQKGSFYHFFSSKQDLAKAAMEHLWTELQPQLDHIFSAQTPGLERLRNYAQFSYQAQEQEKRKLGFVTGCPFTTIGSERCSEGDGLTGTSWEILLRFKKYFTLAIRDACEERAIELDNYTDAANEIFIHYLGCNAAARLSGSLEPMKDLYEKWCAILGTMSKKRRKDAA